jgi:hypothetical protein
MIDRIFKNWKTTILGLGIVIGAMTLVGFEKASLGEASAFIVAGISLFFLKDKNGNS